MRPGEEQWAILGIVATTDAAAIRKAYASKLRSTRPDDDPAAFQRLVEARDWALHSARTAGTNEEVLDGFEATDDFPTVEPQSSTDMPEVLQLLLALPRKTYPDQVEKPWMKVLDALEQTPLQEFSFATRAALSRLVFALAEDLGPMPEQWALPKSALKNPNLLGPYGNVLSEMNRRFGFLQQDTALLAYLDWDQGRYMMMAMEIAAGGRTDVVPEQLIPFREVRAADRIWAAIAFKYDPKMLEHQDLSVADDKFRAAFSPLGLLFPTPVALYYRLYGFAAFAGALQLCFMAGWIASALGHGSLFIFPMVFYPLVAYMGAWHIPGMRIASLGRQVASLAGKGDLPSITAGVEAWSKPNLSGMVFGVILVLALILSVILIRPEYP